MVLKGLIRFFVAATLFASANAFAQQIGGGQSVISLVAGTTVVTEGGANITFDVACTGNCNQTNREAVLTFTGAAALGSDYTFGSASGGGGDVSGQVTVGANTLTLAIADLADAPFTFTLAVTDDAIDEGVSENATVTLTSGDVAVSSTDDDLTLTINDDDTAGFTVTPTSGLVTTEAGGSDTFTVALTSDPLGDVTIPISVSVNPDEVSVDVASLVFTPTGGANPWNVAQTVTVTGQDDADPDGDQPFTVATGDPTSSDAIYNAFGAGDVPDVTGGNLDDDNPGTFAIVPVSTSVNEAVGTVQLRVDRLGGSAGAVSVDAATVDGTAVSPDDFTANAGTLNWAAGDSASKFFDVTIIDDNADEPNESFTVVLSNPTGGAALGDSVSTITIQDNDEAGTIAVDPATYTVAEDGGTVEVTLTRTGGSAGAVSVMAMTVNGTAEAGSDFGAVATTINWADGDTASKPVSVSITDDPNEEGDENFTVVISNATGGAGLGNDTGTVTITDNDEAGSIQIDPASYTVNEDAGTVSVTVTRTGGSDGAVAATVNTADGTATAGADYTAIAGGTVSFANGDAASKTIDVTILDDMVTEGAETFTVTLSAPTNGVDLGNAVGTVTIDDPEDAPANGIIQIDPSSYVVNEDVGTVSVTVTRTGVVADTMADQTVTVDFTTTDGSAVDPDDYTAQGGTLTWADAMDGNPDTASKTIDIPIIDDTDPEGAENFTVTISNLAGAGAAGASLGNQLGTVTINASDNPGAIAIDPASYTVDEDVGTVNVMVTRTGGTDGEVSVTVNTADGSATAGSDYTAIAGGTVTFPDGDATTQMIAVGIIDDADSEPTPEDFTVTISAPTNGATLGNAVGTVTINPSDTPGTVQFDPASYTVDESVGTAMLTVTRTGGSIGAASVDYATADGSAAAGDDYTAANGTLNWADGDAAPKTIMVPIIDDAVEEGDENFTATLSNATGAGLGGANVATVTISANDGAASVAGTIAISPSIYNVSEGNGQVNIAITRSGGSDGEVSVTFATADGTATAGVDYTATNQAVTFADGISVTQVVSVPIINNTEVDGPRSFAVSISGPTGGATLGNASGTVNIQDDDPEEAGQLSVVANGGTEGGPATVTVTRINGSSGAVTLTWSTADGTAQSSGMPTDCSIDPEQDNTDDYVPVASAMVSWADGEAGSKQLQVSTNDDLCIEGGENFTVNLSVDNPDVALSATSVSVPIEDNDGAGSFSITPIVLVTEGTGVEAVLTVTRTQGTNGNVIIDFQTADGTATAGSDYTAVSGSLLWTDGDGAAKQISVPILVDGIAEPSEYFTVTISLNSSDLDVPPTIENATGVVRIFSPVAIPTMSEWGLILLALILAAIGARGIRARGLTARM